MLAAACCWSLRKMVQIFGGRDGVCQVIPEVEAVFPGRKVDRRVLTVDVDAELGLITCARSGIGQMARRSTPRRCRTLCGWFDSSQHRWSRGPGRWRCRSEGRQCRDVPERHGERMENDFWECAQNRVNVFLRLGSVLTRTHVCACEKVVSELTNKCGTQRRLTRTGNWVKYACGKVFCVHTRRLLGNCYSLEAKTFKTNLIHTHWSPLMISPWMIVPLMIFPTSVLPLSVFPPALRPWRRSGRSRCWEVRLPILALPFQSLLKFRVQRISLPVLEFFVVFSTLLFTKTYQRFCCCSVRSRLMIWNVAFHFGSVFVTISLGIRRVLRDVDRREVIKVLEVSFSLSVLTSSVLFVILPLD